MRRKHFPFLSAKRYSDPANLYALILLAVDLAAYYIALFFAYQLRLFADRFTFIGELEFSFSHFVSIWWIPVIIIFFQISGGLYWRRDPFWMESGRLLKSLLLAFIVAFALVSLGQLSASVSRLLLCVLFGLLFITMTALRIAAKNLLFKLPEFQYKAVLVGDGTRIDLIKKAFDGSPYMGIVVVKTFCSKAVAAEQLDAVIIGENISAAILAPSENSLSDPQELNKERILFKHIHTMVERVIYVPVAGAMDMTNAETGQLLQSQLGYLSINNSLGMPRNRVLKRISDIVMSLILLPFALPVIGVLALVVRLTSDGPALFRQERVGRNGRLFKVFKLRSMYKDAAERLKEMLENDSALREEWEREYKLKNDPRITAFGAFLRKSSLDELPQLFNVLAGDMSIVGPRPVLEKELEQYYGENAVYYKMAPPGITGLWQVSGRNSVSYDERISMDNWYIFNWSLWLDIVILLSTPFAVILRRGAY